MQGIPTIARKDINGVEIMEMNGIKPTIAIEEIVVSARNGDLNGEQWILITGISKQDFWNFMNISLASMLCSSRRLLEGLFIIEMVAEVSNPQMREKFRQSLIGEMVFKENLLEDENPFDNGKGRLPSIWIHSGHGFVEDGEYCISVGEDESGDFVSCKEIVAMVEEIDSGRILLVVPMVCKPHQIGLQLTNSDRVVASLGEETGDIEEGTFRSWIVKLENISWAITDTVRDL